ncbi:MAG: glycosyltransferase family 4 protein [Pirellulales bacterium]|nr:glycosyltransferase family 4 protein [Pirellulales bacterium]
MSTAFDTTYAIEETVFTGRYLGGAERRIHEPHRDVPVLPEEPASDAGRRAHAMFCFESPNSAVGQCVATLARGIAKSETPVHIFARQTFDLDVPGAYVHAVAAESNGSLFSQVQEFTREASNAYLREFHEDSRVSLMGFEWSSIPAISLLRAIKNVGFVLSLHSMERQRSNLTEEMSRYIEETELAGLREARLILCHDNATADVARRCVPECAERIEMMTPMTMIRDFQFDLDPGEVKARFQIGPTDPTILFVGDLGEDYGPDLLMKAMPRILRNHKQARCVFIGDGDLIWPLRVQSRYQLLDYAVRLAGHLDGQALRELVYASDVVVVPSRKATPWWPIEAAWAANRPIVTTPDAAPALVRADRDALVVNADDASIAAGVERILTDPGFARAIASEGRSRLEDRYDVNKMVARIAEMLGAAPSRARMPASVEA